MMTDQERTESGLYACCAEPANLYRPEPYRGYLQCAICQRRHFRTDADAGHFRVKGADDAT